MIDPGAAAGGAIQTGIGAGASPAPAPTPEAPAGDAVARFDQAMAGGNTPPPEAAPPAEAPGEPVPIAPTEAASPGDAILRGLSRMSGDFQAAQAQATQAVGAAGQGELGVSDLMRMQMAMTQVSVQNDLVSKVAGKATQSLDGLLKNQ